jgi:hypothetical protein
MKRDYEPDEFMLYLKELIDADIDGDDTTVEHTESSRRATAEVYNPSGDKWPTVINSTNNLLTIDEISYTDVTVEWSCTMRAGNSIWNETFSIGSPLPLPVVRCFAGASDGVLKGRVNWPALADALVMVTVQIAEGRYTGRVLSRFTTSDQEGGYKKGK